MLSKYFRNVIPHPVVAAPGTHCHLAQCRQMEGEGVGRVGGVVQEECGEDMMPAAEDWVLPATGTPKKVRTHSFLTDQIQDQEPE